MDKDPPKKNIPQLKIWISKSLRDARGDIPVGMLSILAGLSEEYIHRIEAGVQLPSKTALRNIATALSVPLSSFDPPKDLV